MPHTLTGLPVEAFRNHTNAVEYQLDYPGDRPESSFITDGETVTLLPDTYAEFETAANKMLAAKGLPLIKERYIVLAYGANANPDRLQSDDKMGKFDPARQARMQVVPHIQVTLPDTMAVWHGNPAQKGSVFAELYRGEQAKGVSLHTHAAFLTAEQLASVSATEGVTYSLISIPARLGSGKDAPETEIAAYAALKSHIATEENGHPVLVADLRHDNAPYTSLTARGMVARMLHAAGVDRSPEEHVELALNLPLGEGLEDTSETKKKLQAEIAEKLETLGDSRAFEFPNADLIGRADFASVPGSPDKHLHKLPQMVIGKDLRATEQQIAAKMATMTRKENESDREFRYRAIDLVDVASILQRRAHDELSKRIGSATLDKLNKREER